ncbi:hypothetical protein A3I36_02230 [Candidatus Giovannonibacteria bacterium RIFCSPLOWO2_02_FULL_45_28]|nr:MAG: hypothetical protein A3I36_02230 [Candidatus Giovannonibacteria bacterium RIFCSPLOWO2_02_FULL_45_28]
MQSFSRSFIFLPVKDLLRKASKQKASRPSGRTKIPPKGREANPAVPPFFSPLSGGSFGRYHALSHGYGGSRIWTFAQITSPVPINRVSGFAVFNLK